MPVALALALVGVALAMVRIGLPISGVAPPRWVGHAILVLALVVLSTALIGLFWPLGAAYRLELVSVNDGRHLADMTWPLAVMCAGVAYGTLTGAARLMTWADPHVRILSPLGGHVDWQHEVCGSVFPPDTPVQLFVYSRDQRWHPKRAEVIGSAWRVAGCEIGQERVPPDGFKYQLVAVSGADEITAARTMLPKGIARSGIIRVFR
jgi:hypothetical protein